MLTCSECGLEFEGNPRRKCCSADCKRVRAARQKGVLRRQSEPLLAHEVLPSTYWQQVQTTGFCWLWVGYLDEDGYGRFTLRNRAYSSHRAVYVSLVGSAPSGKVIDHLCRVRNCVNPDHFEFVDAGVNTLRGFSPPMVRRQRETCPSGHEREVGKRCAVCESIRNKARREYLTEYMRGYRTTPVSPARQGP